MLKIWANWYLMMGEIIHDSRILFQAAKEPLAGRDLSGLKVSLEWILEICENTGLGVSEKLVKKRSKTLLRQRENLTY